MRGVVLAGGNGTRLQPLTLVANKHMLPVYDKPMIYYPIETLKQVGCDSIVLVTGGEHIGRFAELLGDGSNLGVDITYRVQAEASGIAQALSCVEGLVDGVFPVILGDNYFDNPPTFTGHPAVYLKEVEDPERFGVYNFLTMQIVEKPKEPVGQEAVIGFYVYDQSVFDFVRTLHPSARGELEVTDVNNWYLDRGADVIRYEGNWADMGTFDSLLDAGIQAREQHGN